MASLDSYLDDLLRHGRACFSRNDVSAALGLKPQALAAALTRAISKHRLANPRHGFYLILRPEDQIAGAPDPVKWIDPVMKHQGIDYRISLLRAAAFHGSSHQASMVFQVVVPRQLRDIDPGRHRLQFLYQGPEAFAQLNKPELVGQMKSDAGFAKVAGVELTLLDCMRYFHQATGINGVAQIRCCFEVALRSCQANCNSIFPARRRTGPITIFTSCANRATSCNSLASLIPRNWPRVMRETLDWSMPSKVAALACVR